MASVYEHGYQQQNNLSMENEEEYGEKTCLEVVPHTKLQ